MRAVGRSEKDLDLWSRNKNTENKLFVLKLHSLKLNSSHVPWTRRRLPWCFLTCVDVVDVSLQQVLLGELVHDQSSSLQLPSAWTPGQHVGQSGVIAVLVCGRQVVHCYLDPPSLLAAQLPPQTPTQLGGFIVHRQDLRTAGGAGGSHQSSQTVYSQVKVNIQIFYLKQKAVNNLSVLINNRTSDINRSSDVLRDSLSLLQCVDWCGSRKLTCISRTTSAEFTPSVTFRSTSSSVVSESSWMYLQHKEPLHSTYYPPIIHWSSTDHALIMHLSAHRQNC